MFLNIIWLLAGFALLIKGADFLVMGSSSLARRFNVPELIIGLTIVAFGTSMPELIVSVVSAANGLIDVTFGNIIGSNIFNLFCILGLAAMISPVTVQKTTIFKEIPYSIIAALVLLLLANDHLYAADRPNRIGPVDSMIMLAFFMLFIFYVFLNMKNENLDMPGDHKVYGLWKTSLLIFGGLTGLVFGGKLSVDNAVDIAHALGVSERIIGLTIIAAGTSLPELATSAVAAYRKNSDIAVGNVVGSNIFNVFLVLPVAALIHPLPYRLTFNFDLTVLIAGSIVLLFFTYSGKKAIIDRWEGAFLFTGFVVYTLILIFTGN
ncbi:MAG TPA: calcium/sodium antiporter [Bacteroidales bacterium]|nr:calcium/sodium antiporter [Bacteroidales bacterium]